MQSKSLGSFRADWPSNIVSGYSQNIFANSKLNKEPLWNECNVLKINSEFNINSFQRNFPHSNPVLFIQFPPWSNTLHRAKDKTCGTVSCPTPQTKTKSYPLIPLGTSLLTGVCGACLSCPSVLSVFIVDISDFFVPQILSLHWVFTFENWPAALCWFIICASWCGCAPLPSKSDLYSLQSRTESRFLDADKTCRGAASGNTSIV